MAVFFYCVADVFNECRHPKNRRRTGRHYQHRRPDSDLMLAFFILQEAIRPIQLLGTVLVLMGVYVVSRTKA
jgi:hypothetical protein